MAGRVFGATSAPPRAVTTPVASKGAGRISWGAAPVANPLDDRLVNSFKSIEPNRREVVLAGLNQKAKAGDRESARKLQLLVPHYQAPAPETPDYTANDIGSKLYRVRNAIPGVAKDIGKGIYESAKTTGETIATAPHAANAALIAVASMAKGDHGAKLAANKQAALNEIRKTPYGKYFGKTVEENKQMPVRRQLAGIAGTTLENVLNVATLGGTSAGAQVGKAIASKAALKIATKQAAKSESGYIRNMASGQFARAAVHPDDASIMATFIDHARGISKLSGAEASRIELDAARIAEHYNIGGKAASLGKLANAFDKVLSGSPEALRGINKLGEAGKIALPTGKGARITGGGLAQGAKLGAGYSVAEAGKENVGDPGELAGRIIGGTALGAALGAVPGVLGRAKGVKLGGSSSSATERGVGPVRGPQMPERPSHQAAIEAASNKGDMAEVARIINAMPDGDPYKKSMTELFKDRVPKGSLDKPVAFDLGKDVLPADEKFNPSTRVQQYDQSLQDTIRNIERGEGYQQELQARGGGVVISNKETYAKALEAGPLDHETIMKWKAGDPVDAVTLVRAKATLDSTAKGFTDLWHSGKLGPEDLDDAAKELAQLEAGYHVMSAEPGRATQIQSSFIDEAFKKAKKLRELIEGTKGDKSRELIDKQLGEFDKQVAEAKKSGLFGKDTLNKLQSMLAEYATAAKLTSPLTHTVNIVSNLLTLPVRGAENIVSTGWGALKGETSLAQAKYIFGTSQGLKSAASQFAKDLKQAVDPHAKDVTPSNAEVPTGAIPGVVGKVIRTPFNFLSSADNFFKNVLRDSEIHQRAFAHGYEEGFRGPQLAARVEELVKSPTEDMLSRAESVAKEFTFTAEPGPLVSSISNMLGKVPALRLIIPFVQTPTNIAKFQVQRSPLGVFSPRNIKALVKGQGLERREAVARLGVGTMLSVGGMAAVMNLGDRITGAAPTDGGEKDNFYAQGKKPYSIKIGNRWVAYNRFQPLGLYLTQAVGLRDALTNEDSKTAGNILGSMAFTVAKSMKDLPFVSGVSNVIDALNDPSDETAVNKFLGGVVTGTIPNLARDFASASDPYQRNAKSFSDQVKMMIPGLRQQVQPRVDTFGRTQKNGTNPIERGFVKITSPDSSTKLTQALDQIGKETGYYPQPLKPNAKVHGQVLSKADFLRYQALSGHRFGTKLEAALNDGDFRSLSPDDKQRSVQNMLSDARDEAANDLVGKAPQKEKTKKLKKY